VQSNTFTVVSTGQLTYQSLRVGVGNIWQEEYTDAKGVTQQGITAGLWFFIREDSSLNRNVRVYIGQDVTVGRYSVHVLDIKDEPQGGSVQMTVTRK
jgi:hypothetical protein